MVVTEKYEYRDIRGVPLKYYISLAETVLKMVWPHKLIYQQNTLQTLSISSLQLAPQFLSGLYPNSDII